MNKYEEGFKNGMKRMCASDELIESEWKIECIRLNIEKSKKEIKNKLAEERLKSLEW